MTPNQRGVNPAKQNIKQLAEEQIGQKKRTASEFHIFIRDGNYATMFDRDMAETMYRGDKGSLLKYAWDNLPLLCPSSLVSLVIYKQNMATKIYSTFLRKSLTLNNNTDILKKNLSKF